MFIKEIKNPFDDDGVRTIRLQAPSRTVEGLFRVFNGPEIRTWKQHHNNELNLPSSIVEFTGSPPNYIVEKLIKKNIIVKYFPQINMAYNLDISNAVITSQLDNGFQIIGIPDYKESFTEFKRKLDSIPDVLNKHPKGDLCSVMPYIISNLEQRNFEKRLHTIIDREYKMIGIDIRGTNKINLEYMKEILKRGNTDFWIHASNVPRKHDTTSRASYSHVLTYLGIQTYTLKESRPAPSYGMKAEDTEHFDSQRLGIIPWINLTSFFGTDCICKYHNHGGHYYTDDARTLMQRSRIHEMVNGQMELKRAEVTIKEESFEEYIKNKVCASMALFKDNH